MLVFMMGGKMRWIVVLMSFLMAVSTWAEEMESVDYEKYVDEIVDEFSREMDRDYNLICIGGGGRMPYDVEEISVEFHAYRRATVEEARELEVVATERLLEKVNQNFKIRPFLREHPFKPFRAKVSISFMNERGEWWADSIAFVFQVKNKIHYYKKDPSTDPIKKYFAIEAHSESFEEAEKIIAQGSPRDFKGKRM
jgi:hypothetical protein